MSLPLDHWAFSFIKAIFKQKILMKNKFMLHTLSKPKSPVQVLHLRNPITKRSHYFYANRAVYVFINIVMISVLYSYI
jgi:hypothetical protein